MSQQTPPLVSISPESLLNRFRSKKDLHTYMLVQLGIFLPNLDHTKAVFLKQVLRTEKKVLRANEIKLFQFPRYKELALKSVVPLILQDEEVLQYLPDIKSEKDNARLDREFVFGIIGTLRPDFLSSLIKHSLAVRFGSLDSMGAQKTIILSQDWKDLLEKHPFHSVKKGKGVFMLQDQHLAAQKKSRGIRTQQMLPAQSQPLSNLILHHSKSSIFTEQHHEETKDHDKVHGSMQMGETFDQKMRFVI